MREHVMLLMAVVMLLVLALGGGMGVALAATTQNVTITATPSVVSINQTPASKAFGTVAESTDYWTFGSAPTWPLDDGECLFTVGNDGSVGINIAAKGTHFSGGVNWELVVGTPGADEVRLRVYESGDANESLGVNLTTSDQNFILNLASDATKKWESKMTTASSFGDSVEKSGFITLTATEE